MRKPFIIVCGDPKLGKSTEIFSAFQDSYAIISSPNVIHHYHSLCRRELSAPVVRRTPDGVAREFRYRAPKRIKLIDVYTTNRPTDVEPYSWKIEGKTQKASRRTRIENGKVVFDNGANGLPLYVPDDKGTELLPIDQRKTVEMTVNAILMKTIDEVSAGRPPPFSYVIIDEIGELGDRIVQECALSEECLTDKGKFNHFAPFNMAEAWMLGLFAKLKQLLTYGVGVIVTAHVTPPKYNLKGQLEKGGARIVSPSCSNKLARIVDGTIQIMLIDQGSDSSGNPQPSLRVKRLSASEQWNIGLRGMRAQDESRAASLTLSDVMFLADYDIDWPPEYTGPQSPEETPQPVPTKILEAVKKEIPLSTEETPVQAPTAVFSDEVASDAV